MKKKKGYFVVIEGANGSGKTTQANILLKKFKQLGYKTYFTDFPQYYKTFFGRMVGRYLTGEFGDVEHVSPYLSSMLYAADRWQASHEMHKKLAAGYIIISNRYTTSNMGMQTGKLPPQKRADFINWVEKIEYQEFGIPRPDLVIYLDVPVEMGQELVDKKKSRKYLHGKKRDIHEKSTKYLKETEKVYLGLCKKREWRRIKCTKNNEILPKLVIAKMVWKKISEKMK